MPLLIVTCGTLGDDPVTVEVRLQEQLEMAERWSAIIMLEEADIFLRNRSNDSMKFAGITSGMRNNHITVDL